MNFVEVINIKLIDEASRFTIATIKYNGKLF